MMGGALRLMPVTKSPPSCLVVAAGGAERPWLLLACRRMLRECIVLSSMLQMPCESKKVMGLEGVRSNEGVCQKV